jgi:hypothetical protein
MKHAAPEQIVAFRDGELLDPEVEGHIRNCPLCRRQLGEARWVRTHTLSNILKPRGPLPTHDEIAAYLDEALDEREMDRVEIHIRVNDHLLAVFDKLLLSSMKLESPLPVKEKVDELKARLRGPRLLGRLRIFITDRFKQVFHPARPMEPEHLLWEMFGKRIPDADALLPWMEPYLSCSKANAVTADLTAAPPPPPGPSSPRLIDAGRWLIRAVTSERDGEARLELVIEDAKSGQPVEKLPVRLEPGRDDPVHSMTDEKGSVLLPLPEGDSRLEIGEGPRMVLEIIADLNPA